MNRYEKADREFLKELKKRDIDPRDVPVRTRYIGRRTPYEYTTQDAVKVAGGLVVGSGLGYVAGRKIANKIYPGDKYMGKVGGMMGIGVGALPVIPLSKKLRDERFKRNIEMRNELLERFDRGEINRPQSDFSDNYKGSVKLPLTEDDEATKTKLISESLTKVQASIKDQFKDFASTRIGKVILTGATLTALAAVVRPKILAKIRLKNTKYIDVSDYRYTEDANRVMLCINRFNQFLDTGNPVKSASQIPYNDMEKVYLDALDSIERSSNTPEEDKDYLELMWDVIYSFYNSHEQFQVLDNRIRIRPNIKSRFNL